jgi:hypothetical protein
MKRRRNNYVKRSTSNRTSRDSQVRRQNRWAKRKAVREADLDALIEQSPPAFGSFFIEEPKLVFAGNRTAVDPKTGIEQFGPFSTINSTIRLAVIGTGAGIDAFRVYLEKAQNPILPGLNARGKLYDSLVFPDFPGANPSAGLRVNFLTDTKMQRVIPGELFENAVKTANVSTKLRQVVDLITKEIETLKDAEPEPNVVMVVMPPLVEKECGTVGAAFRGKKLILTPTQKYERQMGRRRERTGQEFFPFDFKDELVEGQSGFWNIHHALKAHAMKFDLPTQLVWENRLRGIGLTHDSASMAWNLFTALYYKGGNIPWQLHNVPHGTCYVGISFYKASPYEGADTQTSLAQIFSGVGEGLVLKGQKAIIDKKRDRKAHLDERGAEQLLGQAINLYAAHSQNTKPGRVVLHKTSRYWPEELAGFKKALGGIRLYDFLAIEKLDTRFMRLGKEPPLRGSVISLAPRHHAIFTVGYIPYLRAYPGFRIPNPLEIVEHHGESPTELLCQEIMGLTKINWNSCSFGSSDPITILFARIVGRILTEMPAGVEPKTKYKFYM